MTWMNWRRSRKVLVRRWRDLGICPLICLPEVFLEQTHIFQKYYLRKMYHAVKEISPVTTVNICCWKFALSFTSLSSTTTFFLCTEVLSFQDDLHTYQFLLATPWRRCRLLRNSCMGSDDLFPLSDGGGGSAILLLPVTLCVSMLSLEKAGPSFFCVVAVGQYSPMCHAGCHSLEEKTCTIKAVGLLL